MMLAAMSAWLSNQTPSDTVGQFSLAVDLNMNDALVYEIPSAECWL